MLPVLSGAGARVGPCNVRRCCASRLHQLDADLPVPRYAREGDAGADLVARTDVVLASPGRPGRGADRGGGGHPGRVRRPGASPQRAGARHGVTCLNAPGLVDSGYRGELQVILVNHDPEHDYAVSRGDRIAQLVLVRVEQAAFELVAEDGLGESERGGGGFGHTGT